MKKSQKVVETFWLIVAVILVISYVIVDNEARASSYLEIDEGLTKEYRSLVKSVYYLEVPDKGTGTAFAISPNTLVTAKHVSDLRISTFKPKDKDIIKVASHINVFKDLNEEPIGEATVLFESANHDYSILIIKDITTPLLPLPVFNKAFIIPKGTPTLLAGYHLGNFLRITKGFYWDKISPYKEGLSFSNMSYGGASGAPIVFFNKRTNRLEVVAILTHVQLQEARNEVYTPANAMSIGVDIGALLDREGVYSPDLINKKLSIDAFSEYHMLNEEACDDEGDE